LVQPLGRVLVVDDEADTRMLIVDILEGDGYDICSCPTGEQAMELLEQRDFDLVLSDIKMPGITGVELLRYVRRSGFDTEVILMTAYASVETAVQALRGEAFDYLIKPFSLDEFRQRVRSAIQMKSSIHPRHIVEHYEALSIDHNARRVWVDGYEAKLTKREFDVLAYLFECRERVITIQELLERVWEVATLDERSIATVRTTVRRLRQKIEDDIRHPRYIKNVWGVGYQLGAWPEGSQPEMFSDHISI